MDDDFDSDDFESNGQQSGVQAPVMPPPAQHGFPPIDLPYGPGHEAELQQLTFGLGNLEKDFARKKIDGNTYQDCLGQIMPRLQDLAARKKQAQAQQQQDAMQATLGQQAQLQAITAQNQQHNAAVFPTTLYQHLDPATGQTTTFYQSKPGEWEVAPAAKSIPASQAGGPNDPNAGAVASADPAAGSASAEGQTVDDDASQERPPEIPDEQTERPPQPRPIGPDGQPLSDQPRLLTVYDQNGIPRHQRIPTLAEHQAMVNAPTPQAQAVIASQIGHGTFQQPRPGPGGSMLVQQGPFTEQYDNGRLVGTNRPQPQQPGSGSAAGFTPDEIQHARNVAAAVTAGMPPGFHRDVQAGNAMRQTLLTTAHAKEQDRRATALAQQQQAKAATAEKAKAAAALEQERKESRTTAYKSVDEEYKAAILAKGKDANATIPPQYATPEARLAEAQRIHRESWAASHPDSQEAKDIAAGKSQAAATEPSDQDKIAALGKAAETHFNTPGQQGFFYNTADANTAKSMADVLTPAFHENRPLTATERQQYDALHKQITDPQLRDRLDWNGKFAQGAKGIAGTVQRGASGAPVYRDPKIAAQVNQRLKEIGFGERTKSEGTNEDERKRRMTDMSGSPF